MVKEVKRAVAFTWKEERDSNAKANLETAKKLEEENKDKRRWIRKSDNCWIFAKKELSVEKAIERHNKKLKSSNSKSEFLWKNQGL